MRFTQATCIGLFVLRSVAFISSRSRALPSLDGTCCSTDSGTFSIRLQTIWIFCFLSLDRICRPAKQIQQYKRLEIEEKSSHFSNNSVVLCRWWSWQCLVFHRRSFYRFKWLRDSTSHDARDLSLIHEWTILLRLWHPPCFSCPHSEKCHVAITIYQML